MKIKNVSQQNLNIAIQVGKQITNSTIRPNQVMYCENDASITKQLVIYEKKMLIVIDKHIEKPDYVENYKPYFESGTYMPSKKTANIVLEEELDDQESEQESEGVFEIDSMNLYMPSEEEESDEMPVKKGRGRPKKIQSEQPLIAEKKQRGRPKGSTKNKQ